MTEPPAWPAPLSGIIECVITTPQPDGRWNVAALGLHADDDHEATEPVRARTWGETRTKKNLKRSGTGRVQFVGDAVDFATAALDRWDRSAPILDRAAAWVRVEASVIDTGRTNGTAWLDWSLAPRETMVRRREVPLPSRGFGAIVEMTIAASRLDVEGYDERELRERLDYFAGVATRCGGARERDAVDRIAELSEWTNAESAGRGGTAR